MFGVWSAIIKIDKMTWYDLQGQPDTRRSILPEGLAFATYLTQDGIRPGDFDCDRAIGMKILSKDVGNVSGIADVSVIIVNYGTAELALEAAASVLDRADRVRDIHIVDNASPGTDAEVIARAIAAQGWGARVTLHAERTNHGFGRGNNLVIAALAREAAPPDKIFLLNPDARLDNPGFWMPTPRLAQLVRASENPGASR
jgi:hypothetical protein